MKAYLITMLIIGACFFAGMTQKEEAFKTAPLFTLHNLEFFK